jgi:hypothetical protein
MSTATIVSSPDRTLERTAQLSQYLRAEVLNERFLCRSYDVCRASCSDRVFYEGQLPHVGQHYDLQVDGKPTRIVIVGQEYGHGPALVRLEGRAAMIRDAAAKGFRGRNPHMKGTTTILRLLLHRNAGDDALNEQLFPNSAVHIFEGFARLSTICSAQRLRVHAVSVWEELKDSRHPRCGKTVRAIFVKRSRFSILRLSLLKALVSANGLRRHTSWLIGALLISSVTRSC